MESIKQSIYDFVRSNNKALTQKVQSMSFSKGILKLTYPSGFTYELREEDFPTRDLVPCYEVINGEYKITHYEQDSTPLPSTPFKKPVFPSHLLTGGITA